MAAAFLLLGKDQYNFLPRSRSGDQAGRRLREHLRKDVIELVLSTDMKMHFSAMGLFASKVLAGRQQAARREHAFSRASPVSKRARRNASAASAWLGA